MTDYTSPKPSQPSPPPLGWLQSELLRQIATTIVRWALTSTGAALVALGWVGADTFQAWADAHTLELVGLALGALMALWSIWNKVDLTGLVAHAANRIIPTRPLDDEITVEKVREHYQHRQQMQKAFERKTRGNTARSILITLLSVGLIGSQSGCNLTFWHSEDPYNKFSQANKEISAGVLAALTVIDKLNTPGPNGQVVLGSAKAVPAARALGRFKNVHREAVIGFLPFLQSDGTREKLVIPVSEVEGLRRLIASAVATGLTITNDPAILDLDATTRAQIQSFFVGIAPFLNSLAPLLAKIKTKKDAPASLRDIVAEGAEIAEMTAIESRATDGMLSFYLPVGLQDALDSSLATFGKADLLINTIETRVQ